MRHRKGIGIAVALLLVVAFFLNALTSCSVLVEGGLSGVGLTTYPSADEDLKGAEAAYSAMEAELQEYLDNYEATHDYDEYVFDLDEISHDPYVLLSLLTALKGSEWTLDDVQSDLEMLFERQYILTEDVTTETRYDENGEAYEYTVCTVTLENFDLSHLPVYLLTEDKLSMYSLYMATLGNRPDLFPGYAPSTDAETDYEIPPEALEDEQFAAMMAEAEKYIGFPYVWGGSNPVHVVRLLRLRELGGQQLRRRLERWAAHRAGLVQHLHACERSRGQARRSRVLRVYLRGAVDHARRHLRRRGVHDSCGKSHRLHESLWTHIIRTIL